MKIKDYNVMIDRRNFFDQPVKNNFITYDNIRKIAIGHGDDYLLDYDYFINYYKMIAIDLSKQQELDDEPKAIQQISFTSNVNPDGNVNDNKNKMFFIIEETKEIISDFSQGNVEILCQYKMT